MNIEFLQQMYDKTGDENYLKQIDLIEYQASLKNEEVQETSFIEEIEDLNEIREREYRFVVKCKSRMNEMREKYWQMDRDICSLICETDSKRDELQRQLWDLRSNIFEEDKSANDAINEYTSVIREMNRLSDMNKINRKRMDEIRKISLRNNRRYRDLYTKAANSFMDKYVKEKDNSYGDF